MEKQPVPMTALAEAQQAQVFERCELLRSGLEEGISKVQIPRTHHLPPSTLLTNYTHQHLIP